MNETELKHIIRSEHFNELWVINPAVLPKLPIRELLLFMSGNKIWVGTVYLEGDMYQFVFAFDVFKLDFIVNNSGHFLYLNSDEPFRVYQSEYRQFALYAENIINKVCPLPFFMLDDFIGFAIGEKE